MIDRSDAPAAPPASQRRPDPTEVYLRAIVAQGGTLTNDKTVWRAGPKVLRQAANKLQGDKVALDRAVVNLKRHRAEFAIVAQVAEDVVPMGGVIEVMTEMAEELADMIERLERAREMELASDVWRNPE